MNRLVSVASKFAVGAFVGVGAGYAVSNSLVYLEGTPVYIAIAVGYGVGFFCNLATQIKTGTVKLEIEP